MRPALLALSFVFAFGSPVLSQDLLLCEKVKREITKEWEDLKDSQVKYSNCKPQEGCYKSAWVNAADAVAERLRHKIIEGRRLPCLRNLDFNKLEIEAVQVLRSIR